MSCSDLPRFSEYLRKKQQRELPTLSVGERVEVRSVKRHQSENWLGMVGSVVWFDHKNGQTFARVRLENDEEGTFEHHQLTTPEQP